jgi:hypothetical protein
MANSDDRARNLRDQAQTQALAFDVQEFSGYRPTVGGGFREFKSLMLFEAFREQSL